jgi:L-ascorbate metabolism protein UlaG (beta-lactamase superfamily)
MDVNLPCQEYPESYFINTLMESKVFNAFYKAERNKILTPIHWEHDISLPPEINGSFEIRDYDGHYVIHLKSKHTNRDCKIKCASALS